MKVPQTSKLAPPRRADQLSDAEKQAAADFTGRQIGRGVPHSEIRRQLREKLKLVG